MVNANKKRGTTLKQRFVKWLVSEYFTDEIRMMMENAGLDDAVCKVDDLESKFDDFEYQLGDFENKCDDMESKVDDFEYNTIQEIRDEADRAIQDAKSELIDLVNEKYDAELTFKSNS